MVDQWINDGLSKIHYLIANSGEDYFKSSVSIPLVNGTKAYTLATSFCKVNGVDLDDGGSIISLQRYMTQERNMFSGLTGISSPGFSSYMYRIVGNDIELIPTPGTGTIIVNHVPHFDKLIADGQLVHNSVQQGWEAYAVYDASAKVLMREESDASFWIGEAQQMFALVKNALEPRDKTQPLRITDVWQRYRRSWFDGWS